MSASGPPLVGVWGPVIVQATPLPPPFGVTALGLLPGHCLGGDDRKSSDEKDPQNIPLHSLYPQGLASVNTQIV